MEVADEEELNGGEKSISEMKPAELVAYAKEKFNVELKANTPKPTLVKQVEKLIAEASAKEDAPKEDAAKEAAPKEDAPIDGGSSIEKLTENQE